MADLLCNKYWNASATSNCSSFLPASEFESYDSTKDCPFDLDSNYLFYEDEDESGRTCRLWKIPETEMSNLILPGLVFFALCALLFIMIFKSVRERNFIEQQYLSNYKELAATGEVNTKPSRVPKQQFTCGGMQMTFQVSSNLNQDKGNKPASTPKPAGGSTKI